MKGKRKGGKEEEGGKRKEGCSQGRVHGQLIKGDDIASGKYNIIHFYGLHGNCLPLLLYFILS